MFRQTVKIYKRALVNREWVVSSDYDEYICHIEGVSANRMDNPHYQPDNLFAVVIPEVVEVNVKDEIEVKGKRYIVVAVKHGDWGIDDSLNNTTLTVK